MDEMQLLVKLEIFFKVIDISDSCTVLVIDETVHNKFSNLEKVEQRRLRRRVGSSGSLRNIYVQYITA